MESSTPNDHFANNVRPNGGCFENGGWLNQVAKMMEKALSVQIMIKCGICKSCTDQHLLAKCDTSHLYYNLGCLNPPLIRRNASCMVDSAQRVINRMFL